jgi:hypothetical protein
MAAGNPATVTTVLKDDSEEIQRLKAEIEELKRRLLFSKVDLKVLAQL